jgi:hypothetical protein
LIWLPVPSLANNLLWETKETKTNLYVLTPLWICFWDFLASKFQKHTYQNAKAYPEYFWVPVVVLYKLKALIICKKVGAAAAALQATLNTSRCWKHLDNKHHGSFTVEEQTAKQRC